MNKAIMDLCDEAEELRAENERLLGEDGSVRRELFYARKRIQALEAAGREMRSLQRERDAERACESPNDQAEVLAETSEARFDALLATESDD